SGNNLLYSSYIGGDSNTGASKLAVNDLGEVCILGFTSSRNFGAIGGNSTYGGGMNDGIIYLLSVNGTPVYSSYFGGNGNDALNDVVLDSSDRFLITGHTGSTDLPTKNAYDESYGGSTDAFLLVLSDSSTTPVTTTDYVPDFMPDITLLVGFVGIAAVVVLIVLRRKRSSIM
ncbi:MAG: hypothetical protein ACTSU3_06900, partial [Candidatus Thorarchaeota archaeon]